MNRRARRTTCCTANPHLARALRFRARRWHKRWHPADGLVDPGERRARGAGQARAVSAAVLARARSRSTRLPVPLLPVARSSRLSPREQPEPLEEIDALRRGVLMHEVLRRFGSRMRAAGRWPLDRGRARVRRARRSTRVIEQVAAEYRDELAPAIRARLGRRHRRPARRLARVAVARDAQDPSWTPAYFELGFGLTTATEPAMPRAAPSRWRSTAASRCAARSISSSARTTRCARPTTRPARAPSRVRRIAGGARAAAACCTRSCCEKLFPGAARRRAVGVLLHRARRVPAHRGPARRRARDARPSCVAKTVGDALDTASCRRRRDNGACERCDFGAVCGPYEEQRVAAQAKGRLERLTQLRSGRSD